MEIPRMGKDELKRRLDDNDIAIIDVRREVTDLKIKNAVIRNPEEVDKWMDKYPKNKTLLFYCA